MSFHVGNLFPKMNLTKIATEVGDAVATLESVAGPKAGWTKFASQFEHSLNSSPLFQATIGPLPNPIHTLTQSLLSGVGAFLQGFGNNLAKFGAGLESQPQPRQVKGVESSVTLPSINSPSRLSAMSQMNAAAQSASSTSGAAGTSGSSDITDLFTASSTGDVALAQAGDSLFSKENDLFNQMAQLASSNDPSAQAKLMEVQAKLQQIQQMITMITNMLQSSNDTKKAVIQNMRV